MSYLLDANVFIQAKNLHYGLDFCPAFWQWLIDSHDGGRVFSIDKVAEEIATGADELTQWTQDHGGGLFRKTDAAVAAQFGKVSSWVMEQQYEAAAINTFSRWQTSSSWPMPWPEATSWSLMRWPRIRSSASRSPMFASGWGCAS